MLEIQDKLQKYSVSLMKEFDVKFPVSKDIFTSDAVLEMLYSYLKFWSEKRNELDDEFKDVQDDIFNFSNVSKKKQKRIQIYFAKKSVVDNLFATTLKKIDDIKEKVSE